MLYSQVNPSVVIHQNVILHGITLANGAQISNLVVPPVITDPPLDQSISDNSNTQNSSNISAQ